MDNQKKPSKYGTLYHKPEHYERLWMLESSRKPEYLNNTFEADNERAGGMQLRRIAFDELQNKGYFKDRKYEEITPNEAMAGAMKYSSIIADNYGLTNEYWNALAFKEGPTAIKALYDKHGGNLKKAMGDPALRTEGREYLTKYLKTKLSDQINEKPAYVKDMYKVILEGGDINSVDPKKYYVSPTVKKAKAGLETKKEDNGFELNKMLTMPGMTKYTAGLSPVASAMANSIGLNGQTKGDLLGGAGMGALSGFLSGGPLGAILGGAGSLLTYGSNMAAKQLAEKEGREAEIKSKTIPGREGMEMPLMYGQMGVSIPKMAPNPLYQDSLNLYNGQRHYEDYVKNQYELYGNKKLTIKQAQEIRNKYRIYYPEQSKSFNNSEQNLIEANNALPKTSVVIPTEHIYTREASPNEYEQQNIDKVKIVRSDYKRPTTPFIYNAGNQNFGPLASGYKNDVPSVSNSTVKNVNNKVQTPIIKQASTNVQTPIIDQAVANVENKIAEEKKIIIPQHSKMVNGQRIPITEKEANEIMSKGKVISIPGQTIKEEDRKNVIIKPLLQQGGEVVPRLLNNFIKKYSGGGFSTEGYRSDSPDVDNAMNIIPGGNISMKDVNFPVTAYPMSNGQIQGPYTMTPDKEYNFSSADAVIEIPEAQMGKEIGGVKEGIHVFAHTPKSYYYNLDNLNPDQATEWLKKTDDYYNQKEAIAWINEDIKDENSAILAGKGKVGELAWQLNKEGNKAFPSVQNQIKTIRKSNIHPLKSDPPEIMELYDKKYYTDNTFKIEAERGKKILEKQYGPVTIHTANKDNFEDQYKSIPEGSNVMFLDHSGDQMFGLGLNKFQNTLASKQPKICIGGSCYSAEQFTKLKELLPNSKVLLSEGKWKGFNANNKGDEAIIPKSTDEMKLRFPENRPHAEPNLITENYQRGGYIQGNAYELDDKEIQDILLPEVEIIGKKRRRFDTALDVMGQVGSLFLGKKYDSLENKYVEEPLSGSMKVALDHALNVAMPIEVGSLKFFENAGNKLKSLIKNKNASSFNNSELLNKLKQFDYKMNQPKLNNKDASAVLNDFKTRIKTTEGTKRAKALGIESTDLLGNLEIYSDNNTLGSYSNDLRINLNKDLPEFRQVTRHEIEHGVQDVAERSRLEKYKNKNILQKAIDPLGWISNEGTTNIDRSLEKLELRKTPQKVDWKKRREERGLPDPNQFYNYLSNKTNATNYFDNGSQGKEKSAMLAELQQYMVDTKKINHAYDNITPEIVKNTHVDAMFDDEQGGKFLRILNIMKANDNNYNLLADNLNKMLSVAPLAAAGAINKKDKKQEGGYVQGETYELDDKEIKRLLSLGYQIQ